MQLNNIQLNTFPLGSALLKLKILVFVALLFLPIHFGLCESVLDKFMSDSFGDSGSSMANDGGEVYYENTTSSIDISNGTLSAVQGITNNESQAEEGGDTISRLSKLEDEKLENLEFSLIGSKIVDTYRYLAIGDEDRFAKSVKKVVMKSDDSQVKSQGYYLAGLLKMKEKDYKSAGQNFLDGYKHGQDYFFGAYNLFGLVRAMHALEKKEEACTALNKLIKMIDNEDSDMIYPSLLVADVKDYSKKNCR